MIDGLLVLNAGSSSLKFAIYALWPSGVNPEAVLRGQVSGIGSRPFFSLRSAEGTLEPSGSDLPAERIGNHDDALREVLGWIHRNADHVRLRGVGHRVVHGGPSRSEPEIVTPALLEELHSLCRLAPHHQPHNLSAIRAVAAHAPDLRQVACFDTAFHTHQPSVARRLPLPPRYRKRGIMGYGFHGLSYQFIVGALPGYTGRGLPRRLVAAHLGNGASLCAIKDGVGIATTMGFSTLDGVIMGTRCGSIDPGALLYLMREDGLGEAELTDLLYNQCGLLGLSGLSADMEVLLGSENTGAVEAVESYCYALVRAIGSLAAVLKGVDALVFTGGIGERAVPIREKVCMDLRWLGLELDQTGNRLGGPRITESGSLTEAWVIPTDEELVIARETRSRL